MRVSRNPDTNIRIKVTTAVNKAHTFFYFCGVKFRQENWWGYQWKSTKQSSVLSNCKRHCGCENIETIITTRNILYWHI